MRTLLMNGRIFLCIIAAIYSAAALAKEQGADTGAEVYQYFSSLDSFSAYFTQRVEDDQGNSIQESEGEVWIKRPGRFRWNYQSPYKQEIVANGIELWTYDPDLEQATVKPMDTVLAVTPAMLLSGVKQLREIATIKPLGVFNNKHWYQLIPLKADDAVDQVQVAFLKKKLSAIRVNDSFGNTTTIQFSNQQQNKSIPDNTFSIELPAGTDILGAK